MTYQTDSKVIFFQNGSLIVENKVPIFKSKEEKDEIHKKVNSELFDIFEKLNLVNE